jgi:WD40 repeat protein
MTVTHVFPTNLHSKNGSDRVTACEFAPNGKTIVSASWNKKIKIWNVASGTCQATLEGHRCFYCLCCLHLLAAAQGWGRAFTKLLENGSAWVRTVAWSFDGNMLASGGDDMRIILWDAKKGEHLTELKGHR